MKISVKLRRVINQLIAYYTHNIKNFNRKLDTIYVYINLCAKYTIISVFCINDDKLFRSKFESSS